VVVSISFGLHAVEIAKHFPCWEWGGLLAFFPYRPAEVQVYFDHAHNDFFEFAVEVGGVGMTLLAAMVLHSMVYSVRILVRRRDQFARGMAFASLMGVTALMIHIAVDFNLQNTTNGLLFGVGLCIPYLVGSQSRKQRINNLVGIAVLSQNCTFKNGLVLIKGCYARINLG
jgi:hypothetical protein